jgi:hypothetical protein
MHVGRDRHSARLPRKGIVDCSKNLKFAGRPKVVRCKEAKKSKTRSHWLMRGLDFFADAADRRFGAAC